MIEVPIVFAIDNNVVVPCGVTITSLLMNAGQDTFYDIYILCEKEALSESSRKKIESAFAANNKCHVGFVDVGDAYSDANLNSNGHITKATYYRLRIPSLFPQFEKVLYADVDMIIQQDLSRLFCNSCCNHELVGAVLDLAINQDYFFNSELPGRLGKTVRDYFNAGFLVMNLSQMRQEGIEDEFQRVLDSNLLTENDQDVLNIVCNGRVQWLSSSFNFQTNHFSNYMWGREKPTIDFSELFREATLHYTGAFKPWNSQQCVSSDVWWHYYKQSPFFDNNVYFKRQQDTIECYRNDFHNVNTKRLIVNLLGRIKKVFVGK